MRYEGTTSLAFCVNDGVCVEFAEKGARYVVDFREFRVVFRSSQYSFFVYPKGYILVLGHYLTVTMAAIVQTVTQDSIVSYSRVRRHRIITMDPITRCIMPAGVRCLRECDAKVVECGDSMEHLCCMEVNVQKSPKMNGGI